MPELILRSKARRGSELSARGQIDRGMKYTNRYAPESVRRVKLLFRSCMLVLVVQLHPSSSPLICGLEKLSRSFLRPARNFPVQRKRPSSPRSADLIDTSFDYKPQRRLAVHFGTSQRRHTHCRHSVVCRSKRKFREHCLEFVLKTSV